MVCGYRSIYRNCGAFQWLERCGICYTLTKLDSHIEQSITSPVVIMYEAWVMGYSANQFSLNANNLNCMSQTIGHWTDSGPLFTKRTEVFLYDLVKSRGHWIRVSHSPITLKFGTHIDSMAAEMPVKLTEVSQKIFAKHFWKEMWCVFIQIHINVTFGDPNDDKSALIQAMVCPRGGHKP